MIIVILLVLSFALLIVSFLLILFDILKVKNKEAPKKGSLSKLSGYSFGIGLLALVVLMFVGTMLSI